jgi:peptide/nickel transport system substrate-binding protein/2-iminobutanoate/2-iminopropanoate deaminase
MSKIAIDTTKAPRPAGPYSQGIVAHGFLFSAGFAPIDPETGMMPEGVGDQTRQVLRNIAAVLAEHGVTLDDAVKVTAHLQNLKDDFAEYNEAYAEFFNAPFPVRTTVGSQLFDFLVEIDVVVALPSTA